MTSRPPLYFPGANHRPILMLALAMLLAPQAARGDFALTDGNSVTTISDRNGMTVWKVNNTADNVFLSNYYVRVGATGNELALRDLLGAPTAEVVGSNQVTLTYSGSTLRAVVNYTLTGGAPGVFDSRVASSITLTNLGATSLDLHLFQYSDFDLTFDQSNQLDQIRYLSPSSLIQYRAGTPYHLEASVGTAPTHYQATSNFLDFYFKFFFDQDGPTTLNDTPSVGALFPDPPTDSAFAFQWDRGLESGASFRVDSSFRLSSVPEPSGFLLLSLGSIGSACLARGFRLRLFG